jgi:hypothetical protein
MKIHALSTGTVSLKDAFLNPGTRLLRQPRLLTPGPVLVPGSELAYA